MSGGKKQAAITLTFSKRNQDIQKFFEDMKEENDNFVATEYICEAIRFFWENKDKVRSVEEETVLRIVDQWLIELNIQASASKEQAADIESTDFYTYRDIFTDNGFEFVKSDTIGPYNTVKFTDERRLGDIKQYNDIPLALNQQFRVRMEKLS